MKLPQGEEPRFPEDEGMFIGTRPEVSSKLQNKLENRFDPFCMKLFCDCHDLDLVAGFCLNSKRVLSNLVGLAKMAGLLLCQILS